MLVKMAKTKNNFKSVRFKLFFTMCIIIAVIVLCLIGINNVVLESFYLYSKTNTVRDVYDKINDYYNSNSTSSIEEELKRIAFNNSFDIFIETDQNIIIFSTDRDFISTINMVVDNQNFENNRNLIYSDDKVEIRRIDDTENNINYILLAGTLDNGYSLYIRIPAVPIEQSVRISNQALILIGFMVVDLVAWAIDIKSSAVWIQKSLPWII